MTYRISSVLNILLMSLLLAGCSGPEKLKQTPIQKTTASLSPAADNTEWIKRLLATPPDTAVTQVVAAAVPPVVLPIATQQGNSVSAIRYSLVVDQAAQVAWLQLHSGFGNQIMERKGPWKLTQPDVVKLLHTAMPARAPAQTE